MNEPSFIQNIGDRGVRTLADACRYITEGPIVSYQKYGFGLLLLELKPKTPAGICGLLKREMLPHPDIGYALLPEFWGKGYAYESAAAVVEYARDVLHCEEVLAVVNPDNTPSISLLEKMGFQFERMIRMTEGAAEIKLFALHLAD